ncbi:putative peptidoglycan biosynthesis protein MurJ [Streptomyces sp. S4.7]|uniref:murein biosynthesis integral membrane protein MurJ n=1 Tax=Streptomyces sp. S4.7 TaxID=2705439 RepID=UPI001397EFBE|nr:lipid II flippase MurJ [Streptomyces sp. S4.7]QHY96088.1 putative peptidoglycan biosynthesis protein MurJ [Streptomyces sp. S4.7]
MTDLTDATQSPAAKTTEITEITEITETTETIETPETVRSTKTTETAGPAVPGRRPPPPPAHPTTAPAENAGQESAEQDTADSGSRGGHLSNRFLARAALLTAVLTAAGALLGLVRDQTIAHLYGAGPDTDAFLVAWTVPEVASTLLIEDAMALILVPAFSLALARRATDRPLLDRDPVHALLRTTLPGLLLALSAGAVLLMLAAPWVVAVLAPGLPDTQLAVDCTRLTATCAFSFGIAGYCSAALRAHGSFVPPAMIYVAYNIGIIVTIVVLSDRLGVRAAAAGVAVGGVLMVLVQAPVVWRRLRERRATAEQPREHTPKQPPEPAGEQHADERPAGEQPGGARPLVALGLLAPVIVFALTRQSQVLIERFLAAPLPAGAISHLNYAQKVAQMPMVLSLMLCTVTFPVVARAMAAGETDRARRRVERDLALAGVIVLVGAATVVACAPQIIEILFQRGAFDRADTAATATVMRVYALGLLGHTLVGALVRCYFSAARPLWFPALAMFLGLLLTTAGGALLVGVWGVLGIAAGNALGITLTAVLLLHGVARHSVPVRVRHMTGGLVKLSAAAASATGAGWLCGALIPSPVPAAAVACVVVAAVFLVIARAVQAPEIDSVIHSVTRKFIDVR